MTDKDKLEMLKENRDKHAVLKGDVGDWIIKQCENSIGRGGGMIYVTKEQAKVITDSFKVNLRDKLLQMEYLRNKTDLDLVTIARIVEGEEYEIGRVIKVGDIVSSNESGDLYTVEGVHGYRLTGTNPRDRGYVVVADIDMFTLVCAVENREDLAHG